MEEHFNDNYLRRTSYPKSIFKGKILDFNEGKITETEKEFIVKGTLRIVHGKNFQNISVVAFIKKQGKKIFFRIQIFY
ncbi:MAG: hypothetical protein U0T80_08960 [Flavobacteriaceae bacterium]